MPKETKRQVSAKGQGKDLSGINEPMGQKQNLNARHKPDQRTKSVNNVRG